MGDALEILPCQPWLSSAVGTEAAMLPCWRGIHWRKERNGA